MAQKLSCKEFLLTLIDTEKSTVTGNRKYLNNIQLIKDASQAQVNCLVDVLKNIKTYPLYLNFSIEKYSKQIRELEYSQVFSNDIKLVKAALCNHFKFLRMLIPYYLELQICIELNNTLAGE